MSWGLGTWITHSPQIQRIGRLGEGFNWTQLVARFVSLLYSLGALAFLGYLYGYWKTEPTTRVDVIFPSFFPVTVGVIVDFYEIFSLLCLNRARAINPVAIGFDVALCASGIFCFLVLALVEDGINRSAHLAGTPKAYWAYDMNNAMIFMIVFCLIHAFFIILAAGGVVYMYVTRDHKRNKKYEERSQKDIAKFMARQSQRMTGVPAPGLVQPQVPRQPQPAQPQQRASVAVPAPAPVVTPGALEAQQVPLMQPAVPPGNSNAWGPPMMVMAMPVGSYPAAVPTTGYQLVVPGPDGYRLSAIQPVMIPVAQPGVQPSYSQGQPPVQSQAMAQTQPMVQAPTRTPAQAPAQAPLQPPTRPPPQAPVQPITQPPTRPPPQVPAPPPERPLPPTPPGEEDR